VLPPAAIVIVVAADGSEQSLAAMRIALDLAARGNDQIVVVTVWRELHATLGIGVGAETEREWAEEAAAAAAALAEKVGLDPAIVVRHGMPGKEICSVARELEARMVVIGSQGAGRLAAALLGSVSAYVIRHAPCPVLVVRAADPTSSSSAVHANARATRELVVQSKQPKERT
jgi:nucleotide-binding universal stress UspA family protein